MHVLGLWEDVHVAPENPHFEHGQNIQTLTRLLPVAIDPITFLL